jgi:hypothetical protein
MAEGGPPEIPDVAGGLRHPPDIGWASRLVGVELDELDGTSVGRIESLLVDARDGSPTWFVIHRARFGRRSAIPVEFVAGGAGRAWAPFPRETIRSAPHVHRDGGLSAKEERDLLDHFGVGEKSGRLAAISGRPDPGRGSVEASAGQDHDQA